MNMTPHHCTLRQFQYAVAVAETLSFRRAAERCRISQPSLSAQLAQLEEMLGVRLFERDRRHVLITSVGQEILERAKLILRETDDLVALASRSADPFSGMLRIGVIPTISPYLLPRLTPALREAYPRLTVRWVEDKTWVLTRHLETGQLDAALLAQEADIGDVEKVVIAKDPFVLVIPRDHALAITTRDVKVAELRDTLLLVLQEEHCFGQQAAIFCSNKNAAIDAFKATSLTTLVQMVAGGLGATLLPELALRYELADANLCVRAFGKAAPSRTISLVWRKHHPFEAALRQVAATIRSAYATPPAKHGVRDRRKVVGATSPPNKAPQPTRGPLRGSRAAEL
ncbi:MAG: LysR substrate-binding domain-containing protein [Nitrococcus sp.]|nr:LysR substrate-binding domain-containing protein [Nitrococcus sp.]